MIKICSKIPRKVAIAVSGGIDSMSALDFLVRGKKQVTAVHFNHGTESSCDQQNVVEKYCNVRGIPLVKGELKKDKPHDQSFEEHWREERYKFFRNCNFDFPIVTAHHLDDVVEWWIFSSLHGLPKVIPHFRSDCNVLRPFLTTEKTAFVRWAKNNNVPFAEDASNSDTKYMRNHIRHNIVPLAMKVNPGLRKTVSKKIKEAISEQR